MYLFLIQGATGTGKTTLITELEKRCIKGLPVQSLVNDRRRQITGKGLSRDTDTSLCDYFTYYASYLTLFQRALEKPGIAVLDRSILDTMVFARLQFGSGNPIEILGKRIFTLMQERITGILYLPIEFEPVDDGCRNVNRELRQSFDQALIALLEELDASFVTLRGTVEERAESAIAYIDGCM